MQEYDIESEVFVVDDPLDGVFTDGQGAFVGVDIEEGEAVFFGKRTEEAEILILADVAVADAVEPAVLLRILCEIAVAAVILRRMLHDFRHSLGDDIRRVDAVFFGHRPGLVAVHEDAVVFVEGVGKDRFQFFDLDGLFRLQKQTEVIEIKGVLRIEKLLRFLTRIIHGVVRVVLVKRNGYGRGFHRSSCLLPPFSEMRISTQIVYFFFGELQMS